MKIYLIGFMGSGKTTVGKLLADLMRFSFYDMDTLIEDQASASIASVFEQYGEPYFRKLEQKILHQTSTFDHSIIATGGGAPCFYDNMAWIKQNGTSIYLKCSPELLYTRLQNQKQERPLLTVHSPEALLDFITQKLKKRIPYYELADIIYQQEPKPPIDIAKELIVHFDQIFGH